MTIASAFNDIAVAHGGTASKGGSIAGAIDALNDALAGSDQPSASTIEGAVRLLGEHIGGGGASFGDVATFSIPAMVPYVCVYAEQPSSWQSQSTNPTTGFILKTWGNQSSQSTEFFAAAGAWVAFMYTGATNPAKISITCEGQPVEFQASANMGGSAVLLQGPESAAGKTISVTKTS